MIIVAILVQLDKGIEHVVIILLFYIFFYIMSYTCTITHKCAFVCFTWNDATW